MKPITALDLKKFPRDLADFFVHGHGRSEARHLRRNGKGFVVCRPARPATGKGDHARSLFDAR